MHQKVLLTGLWGAALAHWGLGCRQVLPAAPVCGEAQPSLLGPVCFWKLCLPLQTACCSLGSGISWAVVQDDTYTESYISTIGVDFVRPASDTACGTCKLAGG